MLRLKVLVVVLSLLLVVQTIVFVLFGLYYNNRSFRNFVDKEVFSVFFREARSTNTNEVRVTEICSYRIYGGSSDDNLSVVKLFGGGKYFLGSVVRDGLEDIWLFEVDEDGVVVREVFLGKRGENEVGTGIDVHNGSVYVVGEVYAGKGDAGKMWIVKMSNFLVEWDVVLKGRSKVASPVVERLSSGEVIVAFSTAVTVTNAFSLCVARISREGDVVDVVVFPGKVKETPLAILELTNGEYWVVGESKSFGLGETDIFVVSFSSKGKVRWFKVFGTKFAESPSSAVVVGDGVVISTSAKHLSLIKLNLDGNIEWVKSYRNGSVSSVCRSGENLIVTGTVFDPYSPNNVFVFEADKSLRVLWEETYAFSYDETPYGVFSENGFIYIGGTSYNDKTLRDVWLVKLKKVAGADTSNFRLISSLVDYTNEVIQTNIPVEIATNVFISSTNEGLFEVRSIYGLPSGLKARFEKEQLAKKLEEKKKGKIRKSQRKF